MLYYYYILLLSHNSNSMLIESIIPYLPLSLSQLAFYIIGGLGAVMLVYGIFLELERRQDLIFAVGAYCLFIYALYIGSRLFAVAMLGFFLASCVEFIEIYVGLHKHSPEDLKRYKRMR